MKICVSVATTSMTVVAMLFVLIRQSSAMPALPDCDICKEVDVEDDEHSLCSFGCSYYLKTTLPVDASDDAQRDFAQKILPILQLLRNFSPHMTETKFHTSVQLNHETMEFEPVQESDSSEELSIASPSEIEVPGFEHYEGAGDSEFPEINFPHVFPADPSDYADTSDVFSSFGFGPRIEFSTDQDPTQDSGYSGLHNVDDVESLFMFLPHDHESALDSFDDEDEDSESESLARAPVPMNKELHTANEDIWSWSTPLTQNTEGHMKEVPNPTRKIPKDTEIHHYQYPDSKDGDDEEDDSKDVEEILFMPLFKDSEQNKGAVVTSDSGSGSPAGSDSDSDDHKQSNDIQKVMEMTNELDNEDLNEIPEEHIDEFTKIMIPAPKKPSLLDMYQADESYLMEVKRVKKD